MSAFHKGRETGIRLTEVTVEMGAERVENRTI